MNRRARSMALVVLSFSCAACAGSSNAPNPTDAAAETTAVPVTIDPPMDAPAETTPVQPRTDLSTPEAAWTELVKALNTGAKDEVMRVATQSGWERLILFADPSRTEKAFLMDLGRIWTRQTFEWQERSDDTATARLGPLIKASPVVFKKVGSQWKLDYWGGPGK